MVVLAEAISILRAVAREPLRTMRYQNARGLGSNSWRVLDELVDQGALMRLARGVYTAPPDGRDARTWSPSLEIAGLAVATARHGKGNAILMGLGAARFWGAIPRTVRSTVVAVPVAGRRPLEIGTGTVHFAHRELERLEAVSEGTELGCGLITTREQTLYDLLMRPAQGGAAAAAAEGARNLLPQIDDSEFEDLVSTAPRVNDEVRKVLKARGGTS